MNLVKWCCLVMLVLLATGRINWAHAADEQRQAYDKMVEEATREADAYVEQKQQEQKQASESAKAETDAALDERVQAERQRLQSEMETVQKRGLGPNFTEGMRANQIQELQNKLNQLTSDPQAYFGE